MLKQPWWPLWQGTYHFKKAHHGDQRLQESANSPCRRRLLLKHLRFEMIWAPKRLGWWSSVSVGLQSWSKFVQVCENTASAVSCALSSFVPYGVFLKRLLPNPFYHPFFFNFPRFLASHFGVPPFVEPPDVSHISGILADPMTQPGTWWRAFLGAGAQSSSRLSRGGGSRHDDWMMELHSDWSYHMWNICGISVEYLWNISGILWCDCLELWCVFFP